MGKGSHDWSSAESWERLVAALLAAQPKVHIREVAEIFGCTYDTLENRLRSTKKLAAKLKEELESGERGEIKPTRSVKSTPSTPRKPRTPKTSYVINGRVVKTPTKSASKRPIKIEAMGNIHDHSTGDITPQLNDVVDKMDDKFVFDPFGVSFGELGMSGDQASFFGD